LIQYASFYYHRLQTLKPIVLAKCKSIFPSAVFINNILDIKQGILAVIIGTLFKDMRKKPNILKDISGTLGQRKPMDFCTAED
jgi:DNA polymerase delta subunit 2